MSSKPYIIFTEEMADFVCDIIATSSKGLKQIIKENPQLPCHSSLRKLIVNEPYFADKYARAKEMQADYMAEEIIEIADFTANDTEEKNFGGNIVEVENKEWVNRSRLRIDARKWAAAHLAPKKYGDKVDLTVHEIKEQPFFPDETNHSDK